MEDTIAGWIESVLAFFMGSVTSITGVLGQDLQANKEMWGLVLNVQNIVRPVCYTITVIFFLIEFLKISMKMDMLKWETLFTTLIKFFVSKACIDFGPQLMEAIYSTVAEWITTFGVSAYDPSFLNKIARGITAALDNMGFWEMIGFAITSIIPALVLLACAFIIQVIAYGRLIELYILLALMPIPFSMILESEGPSNITKKYILNFAGVCLQGLLIVVSCSLYQYLMADVISGMGTSKDAGDLLFTMVLGAVVMVLAITKCGQWGKQLLNAM